jgi:hypothetical protein
VGKPSNGSAWATLAAVAALAAFLVSCGLLVSFDDVDTGNPSQDGTAGLFAVRGIVDGLGGAQAMLVLNGNTAAPLPVSDGEFVFAERLPDGAPYAVTLLADVPGHPCALENEKGTIAGADTRGIALHCIVSHDADLANLVVEGSDLSPVFDPKHTDYTTQPHPVATLFIPGTTTTITATAHEPNSVITVQGTRVESGKPSAPLPLVMGPNHFEVRVTAADGVSLHPYTIDIVGLPSLDYVKASNTTADDTFGTAIAISGDTLVVGASGETGLAKGVNPPTLTYSAQKNRAGAVYVFSRGANGWAQQAYVKASNTNDIASGARFGASVALDGDTLVVGAPLESSKATGVNDSMNETDTSTISAGAVYVFRRSGTTWSQEAYVKASNTASLQLFGAAVAISGDTLAVGATREASSATGVGGSQTSTGAIGSGAVYVFARTGKTWQQQAYVKASNTRTNANFGNAIALVGDTLAVGAPGETSGSIGVDGNQADTGVLEAGAAYVFARTGTTWSQQAYVKASNTRANAQFGVAVALSADTLAVGSPGETSGSATDPLDITASSCGAVYVYARTGLAWSPQAYVKPSKPARAMQFGTSVALFGGVLAVGAPGEGGSGAGFSGDPNDLTALRSGAVFIYTRTGAVWPSHAYLKATNARAEAHFGTSVGISPRDVVATSPFESSNAKGVNGDGANATAVNAGAAYVFR